jgi:homoserine O-acetyltransferase
MQLNRVLPGLAGLFFYMNYKLENVKKINVTRPLLLDCKQTVSNFPLAYETYGKLNKNKNNAILVFHALTGDQFVSGTNPITKKEGWWVTAVGPGKAIDTNKYFVICANVIGGCMGSWGPKEINKKTNEPYGLNFPVITIRDMVKAQESLLDHLGIEKLLCATGGSMGGMQLLQFCSTFPNRTFSAIPIACSTSHSAQNIALNELARQAIMADPSWDNGEYLKKNIQPKNGLAVARMVGHISYLSEKGMQEKFGRKLQEKADYEFSFNADFQVESYLRHQGYTFVERFDANSILYITRAMDYFDLSKQFKGGLVEAFKKQNTKFLVISFSSDWLYTTKENKDIVIALNSAGANVSLAEINTDKGHDSFLVNEPEFLKTIKGFIDSMQIKFENEKRI